MFKVNKDTITTPMCRSGVLLLTLNYFTSCSGVSIVDFEQVNAGWFH